MTDVPVQTFRSAIELFETQIREHALLAAVDVGAVFVLKEYAGGAVQVGDVYACLA